MVFVVEINPGTSLPEKKKEEEKEKREPQCVCDSIMPNIEIPFALRKYPFVPPSIGLATMQAEYETGSSPKPKWGCAGAVFVIVCVPD